MMRNYEFTWPEYFVDPEKGNDEAGDGSKDKPFRTVRHAMDVSQPALKVDGAAIVLMG